MTTQTKLAKAGGGEMDAADRITLLVAAQIQAGMLERTYLSELILRASRIDQAIAHAVQHPACLPDELDAFTLDRVYAVAQAAKSRR